MRILIFLFAACVWGQSTSTKYVYDGFQECVGGGCSYANQYTKMTSTDATTWAQAAGSLTVSYGGVNAPIAIWHRGQWVMTISNSNDFNGPTYSKVWTIYTAPAYTSAAGPTWTKILDVDWSASIGSLSLCFAPSMFIDSANVLHFLVPCSTTAYPSTTFTIYESIPTDNAFSGVTAPTALTITGKTNVIDFAVYQFDSTFYAYYKNETTKFIELATASTLTGTYTPQKTGAWVAPVNREGPGLFFVGDGYRLQFEDYQNDVLYFSDCTNPGNSVPAGRVSEYQFTEAVGANSLIDHVGSNNGNPVNTPTKVSTGWTFARASTQFVDLGNPSNLNFSGSDFTIAGVFNQTTCAAGQYQAVVNRGDAAAAATSQYEYLPCFNGTRTGVAEVFVSTTAYSTTESAAHSLSAWHTFVFVLSGNTGTLYIDGDPTGTPFTKTGTINNSTNHVAIAASWGVAGVGGNAFDGTVAWVDFFNVALTRLQVRQWINFVSGQVSGRGITIPTYGSLPTNCSYSVPSIFTIGTFQPLSNTPGLARHGSMVRNPGAMIPGAIR